MIPRSRFLAIISAVCLVGSAIGTAVIQLSPGGQGGSLLGQSLLSFDILAFMRSYGYISLFILIALESASAPIPSEIVLPFAGYLVFSGVMGFGEALAISVAALMVGALFDYYMGLKLGRPFLNRLIRWFGINPRHAVTAEEWISNRGSLSVFLARFVPGLRAVISIPAGMLEMNLKRFLLTTLLGSICWSALLIYLGYTAGPLWEVALRSLSLVLNQVLLLFVLGASGFYLAYFLVTRRGPERTASVKIGRSVYTLDYWWSFIKFNIVGLSGVGVNEGVFILVRNLGLFYLYASTIAIEVSIISNFFFNDLWTFRDRRTGYLVFRMVKFNVLMVIGLLLQLSIVYAITTYLGVDSAISNLLAIGGAFLIRYFLSIRYAWIKERGILDGRPAESPSAGTQSQK